MQALRRFPTLQAEIVAAANEALERFRDDSKKTVLRMVDMEASYLTVDFFRKLPQEAEKVEIQMSLLLTVTVRGTLGG